MSTRKEKMLKDNPEVVWGNWYFENTYKPSINVSELKIDNIAKQLDNEKNPFKYSKNIQTNLNEFFMPLLKYIAYT